MARIPKRVADRFVREVPKFQEVLRNASNRDVNEADTVTIVADILSRVFGFDKYTEVTKEFAIRRSYCDLAVTTDEKVQYLIEVKAIGMELRENHLRQAIDYGANHGIEWVVLTNGIAWEVHAVRFKRPIGHELVCAFDLLELDPSQEDSQQKLFLLTKKGLSKAAIEEFHEHVQIVNRFVIGAIVLSDTVVAAVRRELRKTSDGLRVDKEEIETLLRNEVLKRDVVEGEAASEATERVKKGVAKARRKSAAKRADDAV